MVGCLQVVPSRIHLNSLPSTWTDKGTQGTIQDAVSTGTGAQQVALRPPARLWRILKPTLSYHRHSNIPDHLNH